MRFRLRQLEPRILLDAALVAVVVDAISDDASDFANGFSDSDLVSPDDAATPDDALLAEVALTTDSVRILVVSSQVADYAILGAAAQDSVEVVYYDYAQNSLVDIVDAIEAQLNGRVADSIAFATEGSVGEVLPHRRCTGHT